MIQKSKDKSFLMEREWRKNSNLWINQKKFLAKLIIFMT